MTHNPGVLTDGLLVIALLLALWGGWRQGAFASVLSTIGVVFGLICGAGLAPKIMGLTDSTALRFLLGLGTVVLLVGMGNLVGGLLGPGCGTTCGSKAPSASTRPSGQCSRL